MRKQVSEMEARLDDAKTKLTELNDATTRLATHSPSQCEALTSKGHAYASAGKYKYASLMFMSAVKLMESIGLGRSKYVVPPVSALADLYSNEGMDEEAIALYKQAYSIEKDACGADSPQLAKHLQKLGGAYEKQGKMEAATLTLEEAGSVLEHAYGPDHPEVLALREQLAALIEPDPEPEEEEEEEEEVLPKEPLPSSRQVDWSAMGVPEAEEKKDKGKKKPGAKKGGKGGAAAEEKGTEEKEAKGGKKGVKKVKGKKGDVDGGVKADPKALNLDSHAKAKNSITVDTNDEVSVQKFSSQRMRARLEARQRRLAEEGRELSLGSAPPLPPMESESGMMQGDSPLSEVCTQRTLHSAMPFHSL